MARAKICGLKTQGDVRACLTHGAAFVGFVDFEKSPRHIEPEDAAPLLMSASGLMTRVLLTVNPEDDRLALWSALDGIDLIQLHGKESPERVAQIKANTGLAVMKAVGVETRDEVERAIEQYASVADWMLFEAKPPKDSDRPGGNAVSFDWSIMADVAVPKPWMLAGGINASNVAEAVSISGAAVVDASSAVEVTKGTKDATKIAEFLSAVEAAG